MSEHASWSRRDVAPPPSSDIPFPLKVITARNVDRDGGMLRADVTLGRQMSVHEMRPPLLPPSITNPRLEDTWV